MKMTYFSMILAVQEYETMLICAPRSSIVTDAEILKVYQN